MRDVVRRWMETLPDGLRGAVGETLAEWERARKVQRLWAGDVSLWTGDREDEWLGWLQLPDLESAQKLRAFGQSLRHEGIAQILLLGMGGSSLAPEVLARAFGCAEFRVLDSVDPDEIAAVQQGLDPERTLILVSSKSGTTLETNLLLECFLEWMTRALSRERAREHFVAITDPGSPLEEIARREGFRACFRGVPSVGGRYSALSVFGLVPAALAGVDIVHLLQRTQSMVARCRPDVPVSENPAVVLGAILGQAAHKGRDKITFLTSPAVESLGAWLEQLLAESTGKEGKGVIPVDQEALGPPEVYGPDRLFVCFRQRSDPEDDPALKRLRAVGHPVLTLALSDPYDLGPIFFLWEMATAVLGSILGVNPFDQPDVEASKAKARLLARASEQTGTLDRPDPILREEDVLLFADERNRQELEQRARERSLVGYLRAHFERLREGDYFALLAYMARSDAHREILHAIRHDVRDACRVATSLGFGPRFLHSTGQLHKGGPNRGLFLHVIGSETQDRSIPGRPLRFGLIKRAQAYGDFAVLAERGRRQLGIEITGQGNQGLAHVRAAIREALTAGSPG